MTRLVISEPLQAPVQPIQIAHRPFLPGAQHPAMPTTLTRPATETFPLVLRPTPAAAHAPLSVEAWAEDVKFWMETALSDHGAIFVRGLPISTAEELARLIDGLGYRTMDYKGGTGVRHEVAASVMTASDDPPAYSIEPHNEMAFARVHPSVLLLFCETPPVQGGETPIVDVRHMMQQMDPAVQERVQRTGVQYIRHLPSRDSGTYDSWQETFLTDDPREAEQFLQAQHYDFDWDTHSNLTYRYVLPAMITHPQTGEALWFNQIPQHHASYFKSHPFFINADHDDARYPFHCHDGEGVPFSDDLVAHLRQLAWRCAVAITWQQGDLLILDNLLAQHGRMSFVGARRILVTMFA